VTILRIGLSAGNPLRGRALRGHTLPALTSSRGRRDGPDRNTASAVAGESRCGRLIPRLSVRVRRGPPEYPARDSVDLCTHGDTFSRKDPQRPGFDDLFVHRADNASDPKARPAHSGESRARRRSAQAALGVRAVTAVRASLAETIASSTPGKRSSSSGWRSESIRLRPSGRVRTTPASRNTRK
jgi:hypothetical protein